MLKFLMLMGTYISVSVRFAHRETGDSTWIYTTWAPKTIAGIYSETLTGLDPNTSYDFKAQLKYDSTTIEGDTLQFTTAKGWARLAPILACGIKRFNDSHKRVEQAVYLFTRC